MTSFSFNPNDLHRLKKLMFVTRGASPDEASGGHRTRRGGEGTDFLDYRPYVAGDDLRQVDWTLYGRLRQLFIRLHDSPRQLAVTLLIDCSRSMGFGEPVSKLLQAQRIACALGFVGLQGGDRVYAAGFSDQAHGRINGPLVGRRGLPELVRVLAQMNPAGRSDLAACVKQLRTSGRRRGLVVVLSDFLNVGDPEPAMTSLLGGGAGVMVVQVLDAIDWGERLQHGMVRLRDSETGHMVDVRVDAGAVAKYREAFEARREQLERFCVRRGQHYLLASTQDNYLELVCDALRRRAMMR